MNKPVEEVIEGFDNLDELHQDMVRQAWDIIKNIKTYKPQAFLAIMDTPDRIEGDNQLYMNGSADSMIESMVKSYVSSPDFAKVNLAAVQAAQSFLAAISNTQEVQ